MKEKETPKTSPNRTWEMIFSPAACAESESLCWSWSVSAELPPQICPHTESEEPRKQNQYFLLCMSALLFYVEKVCTSSAVQKEARDDIAVWTMLAGQWCYYGHSNNSKLDIFWTLVSYLRLLGHEEGRAQKTAVPCKSQQSFHYILPPSHQTVIF